MSVDKNSRMTLWQKLGVKLDIPPDIINGIHIELRGRNNLTVHGCREIELYTTEEVRLRVSGSVLSVKGSQLYCTAYHSGVAEIDGLVVSVSFEGDKDK